jgi:hypothetical protein
LIGSRSSTIRLKVSSTSRRRIAPRVVPGVQKEAAPLSRLSQLLLEARPVRPQLLPGPAANNEDRAVIREVNVERFARIVVDDFSRPTPSQSIAETHGASLRRSGRTGG